MSERVRRAGPPALLLGLALASAQPLGAAELLVAEGGRAALPIVVAADAIPSERTAAEELATYLERISGARFEIVGEQQHDPQRKAIWIGPTPAARAAGSRVEALGPEAWRLLSIESGLVVTGGRPRGTLYAAYHLLEDHLGVRWWNPFEEQIPSYERLVLPAIDARGEPAFAYRDVHGLIGPRPFQARSRINGHFSELSAAYGGSVNYGPPYFAHTFDWYVPAREWFESHPEYFAEIDGRRRSDAQLCLTAPGLIDLYERELRRYIGEGRTLAKQRGLDPPRYYDVSSADRSGHCECGPCSRLRDREGGDAGPLLEFVSELARRIGPDFPEIALTTLAYFETFHAPRAPRPPDNVIVRFSALQYRDFVRPLTHTTNRRPREELEAWSKLAGHLWVWDYSVDFGEAESLPLPNLDVLGRDLRYYLDRGVEGLLVQHDHPIVSDMRDLKLYVMLRLIEEPYRDRDALLRDFTDGYYGAAGPLVRRYLDELQRAALSKSARIRYPATLAQLHYIDRGVVRRSHRLFDQAEREVAGDPLRLGRLRHARMSLDRATLARWDWIRRGWKPWRWVLPGIGPSREEVAERLQRTWEEQIELRLPEAEREQALDRARNEMRGWRRRR